MPRGLAAESGARARLLLRDCSSPWEQHAGEAGHRCTHPISSGASNCLGPELLSGPVPTARRPLLELHSHGSRHPCPADQAHCREDSQARQEASREEAARRKGWQEAHRTNHEQGRPDPKGRQHHQGEGRKTPAGAQASEGSGTGCFSDDGIPIQPERPSFVDSLTGPSRRSRCSGGRTEGGRALGDLQTGGQLQAHDDRDVFQVSPEELPSIDIHTL